MKPNELSDQELLALIVGEKTAAKIYQEDLSILTFGDESHKPHPRLQACMEFLQRVLRSEFARGPALSSSSKVREYFIAYFVGKLSEVFVVAFLDNQHRLISIDELFQGTIDGAAVYPREVVRRALKHNAAACILAHNHPSGVAEPSQADRGITQKLKGALSCIDVRVLDHFVVGGNEVVSFAERGLL